MAQLSFSQHLRKSILGALPQKASAENQVFAAVMQGFRLTLEDSRFDQIIARLEAVDVDFRGFAYEGVGVALTVFDTLAPWKKRFPAFIRVINDSYLIPTYIGAGLALGRMQSRRVETFVAQQEHPVFSWMVMDGYGFYKGFYTPQRFIDQQRVFEGFSSYGRRVFDQGLGRGIWFARSEDIEQVAATINAFPQARQADLWSGAAFACSYAGKELSFEDFERLQVAAQEYLPQLALASGLAAKRRLGLGHITPHTDRACEVLCGRSAEAAAQIVNATLEQLPKTATTSLHNIWREQVAEALTHNATVEGGRR